MEILRSACRLAIRVLAAGLGAAAAIWLFAGFMVVEVEGSQMLPVLEPGQKVIASRMNLENLQTGDLIVYEAPYYRIDGQGKYLVRRISGVKEKLIEVTAGVENTQADTEIVEKDMIIGKVIRIWVRENAS